MSNNNLLTTKAFQRYTHSISDEVTLVRKCKINLAVEIGVVLIVKNTNVDDRGTRGPCMQHTKLVHKVYATKVLVSRVSVKDATDF